MDFLEDNRCPFCLQRDVTLKQLNTEAYRVNCQYCQNFKITEEAVEWTKDLQPQQRSFLAAYNCHQRLRDPKTTLVYYRDKIEEINPNIRVIGEVLQSWLSKQIWDRLDIVLMNIFMKAGSKPGSMLTIDVKEFPFCFGEDGPAGYFILDRLHEAGLIHMNPTEGSPRRVNISLPGFRKVDELKKGMQEQDSKRVFVAMSFSDSLNPIYENAIKLAIESCGYLPFRVDKTEHNEKICDRIEAAIRQSRFMVADFTENKHGVYYEAGMAKGLNLQIVWCVKESEIGALHFDTRQYNHITWQNEAELRKRLEDRIRAMGL